MLRLMLVLDDSIRPRQTTGERRVEAFIHEFAISYFNSERDRPTNLFVRISVLIRKQPLLNSKELLLRQFPPLRQTLLVENLWQQPPQCRRLMPPRLSQEW